MPKLHRKQAVLAKIETVYGTDPVPTGVANAIEVSDPTITPLAGGTVKRNLVRNTLGADSAIHVGSHVQVAFGVAIAGAGAAGTAPAYGPLLRGCAMAETIAVGVDVTYDPVSASEESVTIYFNLDGTLHVLAGARGNVKLAFPPNDIPRLQFEFTGLWTNPSETAAPAVDFTAFKVPLPVGKTNTATFTLHGYAGVLENLDFDLGNQIEHRDRVGSATVLRTDRQGSGSISFEAPPLTTKDFFTIAKANTLGALQIVHGTAAGNVIQIDAPKVQLLEPKYGESQGISLLDAGLALVPNTGDDELKITVK